MKPQNRTRLNVETLEERSLMAASITASLANNVLTITGTDNADIITVRQVRSKISIDKVAIKVGSQSLSRVDAGAVSKIVVFGQDGNDQILLNSESVKGQQYITKATEVIGGDGHDTIVGGGGFDKIWGGDGNDKIWGGYGSDHLMGGDGNDTLVGGYGNDMIWGGDGNDKIWGGYGNDQLMGGANDDTLYGQAGSDTLWGESGNDWLEAGASSEAVDGGSGTNWNAHYWAVNGTSAMDVDQTNSNRCVVLSALAGAANRGINLAGRISYQGNYTYGVKLFDAAANKWVTVSVKFDGTLVKDSSGNMVDPSSKSVHRTNTSEYWTILFQRAYVKHFYKVNPTDGNAVAKLAGEGNHERALRAVTGWKASQTRWYTESTKKYSYTETTLAKRMINALNHGDVLTVGGTGHAYAVVSVYQSNGVWKVRLYNPWAKDDTHTPDKSSKSDANSSIGFESDGANDGYITMSMATLMKNFTKYTQAIKP